MLADNTFAITRLTKDRVPSLPFLHIKETILGKTYELSLVIASDKFTQELNLTHRNKTYVPNVLSFPLDKKHGEIFLNLKQAKREYKERKESYEYFVALLFIHACLHLKGSTHGSTMEKQEARLLSKFAIKNTYGRKAKR